MPEPPAVDLSRPRPGSANSTIWNLRDLRWNHARVGHMHIWMYLWLRSKPVEKRPVRLVWARG
jgi:hypothetical protein